LKEINDLVEWHPVQKELEKIRGRKGRGRPAYPDVAMFKILLLQQLFDLSDPMMEHHLYDRISFRAFCGFGMMDTLPDETTICRFRWMLQGKTEVLFNLILDQIRAKGLVLSKGTIVDATVMKAACKPPSGGEQSHVDPQAGWTKKQGKYVYGYKASIGADQGTGLILKTKLTSACVHDSVMLPHVVTGQEKAVYADKAYDARKLRAFLTAHSIKPRILRRKPRGKDLSPIKKKLNKVYSTIRCHVERIFAHFKTQHGYAQARYRGWDKNQTHLDLLSMAYNIKRAVSLKRTQTQREIHV
jgi:transposase, IS5 family